MITQLDPSRKGMPWCLMTDDEREFIFDASIAKANLYTLNTDGIWQSCVIGVPIPRSTFWTDWQRPAQPDQPTNLPNGFIARRMDYESNYPQIDGCDITMWYGQVYIVGADNRATHALIGYLHSGEFPYLLTQFLLRINVEENTRPNWAIFREIPKQ